MTLKQRSVRWHVLMACLLAPVAAGAQTVYNPTKIQFASPDHATLVTSYTVEYWLSTVDPATGAPFMTMTLPKAAVTAVETGYEAPLSALQPQPALAVGVLYKATLKAVGDGGTSVRSTASNFFGLANAPVVPTAVSIR